MLARREGKFPADVLRSVQRIVNDVRTKGDAAVFRITARWDKIRLTPSSLRVGAAEFDRAWGRLPAVQKTALRRAWKDILAFHRKQVPAGYSVKTRNGAFRHRIVPLSRVGILVPAASAPLVSTLLMCAGAARAAGVKELVLASSPRSKGRIHPVILAAARLAGIREGYCAGGAAGVAMLAYGTKTVPAVDKVVGPGNIWGQVAKWMIYGTGLEGPSEIVVLADASASAAAVGADLIAQAEHTGSEWVSLITPSVALASSVGAEVRAQTLFQPRSFEIRRSLERGGSILLVRNVREGLVWAERIAPEHLSVACRGADAVAARVRHAGTVLVGSHSPVAAADYGVGPNHVLPTAGTARYASGLGVKDFVRHLNVTRLSPSGLKRLSGSLAALARMEGLEAHAWSVEMNRG